MANLFARGSLPWWSGVVSWWLPDGGWLLVLACLAARSLGDRATAIGTRTRDLVMAPSSRTFQFLAAGAAFLMAAGAAWCCFNGQPQAIDEMAQLWRARLLLAGHFSIPTEPDPALFSVMNAIDAGGR
ncbi:MAG TPA: hypothetical protein VJO52_01325 [Gemmatimonadaceae bacterium]|nr:hypothetical protein [Gemmatimonadaceae bacterium]